MKIELSELARALDEQQEAMRAAQSGIAEHRAHAEKLTAELPQMISRCEPLDSRTITPIALARLALELIPSRIARFEADLNRENAELRDAVRVAHDALSKEIAARETELRAVISKATRAIVSDDAAEGLATDAFFRNPIADALRTVRDSVCAKHPDPAIAARSILAAAEQLSLITIPETL
jgi:hypothetical protein